MSDEISFRGRRPGAGGAPRHHEQACRGFDLCHVEPPPAYRGEVEARILAHAARVARELAALEPPGAPTRNTPKALLEGAVDSAEDRRRRRRGRS